MNWVGGARQRIKVKHERRIQKEFFERKRKEKKFSKIMEQVGKEESKDTKMSQDLMFLYPLQSKLRTESMSSIGSKSPSRRPVTYVDLSKPSQSRIQYNVKLEKNEENISVKQSNSKLQFDKATNDEKENHSHATNSRWMTSALGKSSIDRGETPLPKNILERHIEMKEHKSDKRQNAESIRHNEKINLNKFSDHLNGCDLKKEHVCSKEFAESKKEANDVYDIKIPRIDTTHLFKSKTRFFPQKPADSVQKKEENIGSKKVQDGDKIDESRSSFKIFHSTPLSDIYQQRQGDEASQSISKFANSNLGFFHPREVDDDSKMISDDGYSSKIEVYDSNAMSGHRSKTPKATQEPFQFRGMFEETASIARGKWQRAEEMITRQSYEVQHLEDLHKETDEVNAAKQSGTQFGCRFTMLHETHEPETVFENPNLDTLHLNQRCRLMSCNVKPKEHPFVGMFNKAAPMQSTSWIGRETYSSHLSFNETQSPEANPLLSLSHPYSNDTTDLKHTWEMPEDCGRDRGCLHSGLSNKFWNESGINPYEYIEKELHSDVFMFGKSVMKSQQEYHLGSGTNIAQGQQLSINSIEHDAAINIADSDMKSKSLELEEPWVSNGKLDVRMPTIYQTGLLMKPNSMEDDSEEDRFRQEMYKQRSNSRFSVEFENEKTLQTEQFGSPCKEECTESKGLCLEVSPNRSAYEAIKQPRAINTSSDVLQTVHEALAEVMEMDSDKEDDSSSSSSDSKSVSEEKIQPSQLNLDKMSENGQEELVSSEHRVQAKAMRSNTSTPKIITQGEPLASRQAQNKESNPQALQEGSPLNNNENSIDEKQGTQEALVAENMQIEAGDIHTTKKPATCSVAIQTDKQGCSRCGYIEGEPIEGIKPIEDLKHTGPVIDPSTNMDEVSKFNSTMYTEAGGKVSYVDDKVYMKAEEMNCFKELQIKLDNCGDTKIYSNVSGDCNQEFAMTNESELMRSIDLQMESKSGDDIDSPLTISPCVIQTRSKTAKNVQK